MASRHKGKTTPINYKTRQSAERKCRTDNSMPFGLRDLARTTVLCDYDVISSVIDDIKSTATKYGAFGRYKHQTSDYGYWGDLLNLEFDYLQTEIQVKSYRMYYAVNPEEFCKPVLGDSLYNVIHTETGLEPGLAHEYYEVMRADTSSAATRIVDWRGLPRFCRKCRSKVRTSPEVESENRKMPEVWRGFGKDGCSFNGRLK